MQLSALRTEVRLRAGLADADQIFTDAVLTSLINASLRRISVMQDWPWMEGKSVTTVDAGDFVPTALEPLRRIRWMRYEGQPIQYVNYRNVPDFYGQTGRPRFYTEDSGEYRILPTPDSTYTLEYGYIKETDGPLVNAGDEPELPTWASDLLVADAVVLVARRLRDKEMEARHYGERQRLVADLVDEVAATYDGWKPRIVGYGR